MILTVDPSSPVPNYEQIREQLATMIGSGVLRPQARLPSIRQLATDLSLSTGTVARAYRELEQAGLVGGRGRQGTRVLIPPPVGRGTDQELITAAERLLNPHRVGDRLFGDVASVLVTDMGKRFSGVCIDTGSGTGLCAEHSAIAAMVTAGEYRIARIVAVWRDADGLLYVMPPCGRCREFIRQVDPANLATEVILGSERSAALRELLPAHEWPTPLGRD